MPVPSAKTCQICSKPLTRHERFAGHICSDWRCRWRSLDARLETHRRAAAAALGEKSAESIPIAVVPFRTCPTLPVAEEERQELLSFLQGLLREISSPGQVPHAVAPESDIEPPVDAQAYDGLLASLLEKVCGVCAGFCCYHGAASHAFLDAATLLRFLAQHPGIAADAAVAGFIRHIPAEHYQGSCTYHAKTGCKLPREMRARICNAYECRGLRDTRQHFATTGASRIFVVVRHDNRIMHSAFVDASARRPCADASKTGVPEPGEVV